MRNSVSCREFAAAAPHTPTLIDLLIYGVLHFYNTTVVVGFVFLFLYFFFGNLRAQVHGNQGSSSPYPLQLGASRDGTGPFGTAQIDCIRNDNIRVLIPRRRKSRTRGGRRRSRSRGRRRRSKARRGGRPEVLIFI